MSAPSLLFIHGWGFDAGFWKPLRAMLGDLVGDAMDHGYFGCFHAPRPEGPVLVVAHSLGAMLALRSPPQDCVGLVAVNGFDHFVERQDAPGVPARVIDRMLAKFDSAPEQVVTEFRRRCGDDSAFGPLQPRPLAEHLRLLRDGDERQRSAAWPLPLLVLQGERDPILPPGLRTAVFGRAARLERDSHAEGGHLLPLSHPQWCAQHIRRVLEALP